MENEEDSLDEINKKERKIKRGPGLGIAVYWRKEMHCIGCVPCALALPAQQHGGVIPSLASCLPDSEVSQQLLRCTPYVRRRNFRDTERNEPCNYKRRVSVNGASAVHRLSPIQPSFQPSLVNPSSITRQSPTSGPMVLHQEANLAPLQLSALQLPGPTYNPCHIAMASFFFSSRFSIRSSCERLVKIWLFPLTELRYIYAVMALNFT